MNRKVPRFNFMYFFFKIEYEYFFIYCKMSKDYSKTIIYQIVCKDETIKDTYTGHTTNLEKRIKSHKKRCNNSNEPKHNMKVYVFMRDNGEFDNWKFIMIEEYPCETKLQAEIREEYWRKELKSPLNSFSAHTTKEEKRERHRLEQQAYRAADKEKYKEINEKYEKSEKGIQTRFIYESLRNSIKSNCGCGSIYISRLKNRHEKSKKHIEWLKSKQ